jgi:LCP family protein required for cell wall assembly
MTNAKPTDEAYFCFTFGPSIATLPTYMPFTVRRVRKEHSWVSAPAVRKAGRIVKKCAAPLLAWYVAWRKGEGERRAIAARQVLMQRIFLVLVTVLCAGLVITGLGKTMIAVKDFGLGTVFKVAGATLPVDTNGHTNILLLGKGDASHDGVDLTDSIMIVSLDTANPGSAVILSLPRDLYILKNERLGSGRINSLYRDTKNRLRREGKEEVEASKETLSILAEELGDMLGIDLQRTLMVDFIGFVNAVDAIGGVDIDVPYDINDTEYPGPNYTYETFAITAGPKHLDGETTLKYARSRHTTSDFGRSARQQQLLEAISTKVKNEGLLTSPSMLTDLLRIAGEHLETTLSFGEMITLASVGRSIEPPQMIMAQLSDRNGLYGSLPQAGGFLYTPPRDQFEGASVLLPVSIPEFPVTWKQIRAFIHLIVDIRSVYLAHPKLAVLNAGAKEGSARVLAAELTRYGFDVAQVANAKDMKQDATTVNASSENLSAFFADLIPGTKGPLPAELATESGTTVTILLGKNYTYTPFQSRIVVP